MKRGEEIANKLAALITEKMEKRAHKGDWKDLNWYDCFLALKGEMEELEKEVYHKEVIFGIHIPMTPEEEKAFIRERKGSMKNEIADVAAYCAIMLDVLEKE